MSEYPYYVANIRNAMRYNWWFTRIVIDTQKLPDDKQRAKNGEKHYQGFGAREQRDIDKYGVHRVIQSLTE